MLPIYAYAEHLLASLVLLVVFVGVYTRITPFNEFALIRQGNVAAALSLGGSTLGFCFTLSSSLQHNDTFLMFLVWSLVAMVVQSHQAVTVDWMTMTTLRLLPIFFLSMGPRRLRMLQ